MLVNSYLPLSSSSPFFFFFPPSMINHSNCAADDETERKKKKKARTMGAEARLMQGPRTNFGVENAVDRGKLITSTDGPYAPKENTIIETEVVGMSYFDFSFIHVHKICFSSVLVPRLFL